MPGADCAFPNCGVTRREKFASLAIFQVPNRTGEFYRKWRKDILDVLLKYREVEATLRERLSSGKVYICERHFHPEDIVFTSKFCRVYCMFVLLLHRPGGNYIV